MGKAKRGFSTRAVHEGHEEDPATGAVGVPIYQNATFLHPRRRDAKGRWVPNPDWIYTRWANPTTQAVERKVASLEGAEACLAFSSGMAAIASSVLANARAGERLVAMAEVYGGTTSLFSNQVSRLGIDVAQIRSNDAQRLAEAVDERTRVVYVETPSNPFNRVVDVRRLSTLLRRRFGPRRPTLVVDATLATPYNLRPLEQGADLVVHSASKYLNGHGDVIAGVVSGSSKRIQALVPWMRNLGASIDPHQAYLLGRGMRTLPLRIRAHNENGVRIARYLAKHTKVKRVWHPSLSTHPDHAVARRTMAGYGSIVSFQPRSRSPAAARRFLETLEVFHAAPSLGSVDSLATIPAETSHSYLSPAQLRKAGLSRSFIRLAVGVEDAADLEADLRRALARLG